MYIRSAQHIDSVTASTRTVQAVTQAADLHIPQSSLTNYISFLSLQLRTSEKVTCHALLKSSKWTKSCYDLLSRVIAKDLNEILSPKIRLQMGVSLSSKTLQKIVTENYSLSYPIDPRTLNTLNKIVCFLGYKNWNNFISFFDESIEEESPAVDTETSIKTAVEEAIKREHYAYTQLPEIEESHISKSYIKGSPSFNLIMDVLVEKSKTKQVISNDYNPSSYEILDISVKKIEDNYAQVHTKVYWLLCWWDTSLERYVKRYKDISDHFYILNKDHAGKWMIKTNASMSDLMEIV